MSETSPPTRTTTPLEFHGSGGEYFRIWIVNLCLTIVTFGIYTAWAKVRWVPQLSARSVRQLD